MVYQTEFHSDRTLVIQTCLSSPEQIPLTVVYHRDCVGE